MIDGFSLMFDVVGIYLNPSTSNIKLKKMQKIP